MRAGEATGGQVSPKAAMVLWFSTIFSDKGVPLERVMNSSLPDVNCCDGKKHGIPNRRQR